MSKIRHTRADEPHFLVRSAGSAHSSGHQIRPHRHGWGQLIYSVSGVMTVSTSEGVWVVPPHWALWAPAGAEHAIAFTGAAEMRTLYLSPTASAGMPTSCSVVTVSAFLREMILRAVEIGMLNDRIATHRALALLIVDAVQTQPTPALDLPLPASADLRAVADELSNGEAPDAMPNVARRSGVGLRTLERRFHAETGMSIGQWRRKARLMHGLRRIAAGSTVKDAAQDAGYASPSAFVSAFAATFRTTPGRYFAGQPL